MLLFFRNEFPARMCATIFRTVLSIVQRVRRGLVSVAHIYFCNRLFLKFLSVVQW